MPIYNDGDITRWSPCRSRTDKPRRHHCSPEHAALVTDYRLARVAWELQAEDATSGYAAELEEYRRTNPPVTFKAWLQHSTRKEAS